MNCWQQAVGWGVTVYDVARGKRADVGGLATWPHGSVSHCEFSYHNNRVGCL